MADDTRQRTSSGSSHSSDESVIAFQGYKAPDETHDSRYTPKSAGSSSSTTSFRKLREELGYQNPQLASQPTIDEIIVKRPTSANAFPGGTAHTAGGEKLEDKNMVVEVLKNAKFSDLTMVHKQPCARDGFITGIGVGGAVGATSWVFGKPIPRAANWAAATFVFVSFGAFQICNYKRSVERHGVKMMHDVMAEKKQQKKNQMELAKAESERRKKLQEEEWRTRSWWQKWNRGQREG